MMKYVYNLQVKSLSPDLFLLKATLTRIQEGREDVEVFSMEQTSALTHLGSRRLFLKREAREAYNKDVYIQDEQEVWTV